MTEGPADLLGRGGAEPGRPLLTYYDDAPEAPGRVELSWTTLSNWVAKTANLLRDGLAVQPGDRVTIVLPTHWQTAAVLLACWSLGAVAAPRDPDAAGSVSVEAGVVFCPARLASQVRGAEEVVALSLRPFGDRPTSLPSGAIDFAAEVPGHGDRFTPEGPVSVDATAVDLDSRVVSGRDLMSRARDAVARWGLRTDDRVLSTLPYATMDGLLAGLLAPMTAGAGVVLCAHLDPASLPARIATERVSAVAGAAPPAGSPARRLV